MKKGITCTILFFLITSAFCQNSLPFSKGINLANFFETWDRDSTTPEKFNKYDEADFACFKSMGMDVIRLNCSFDLFTDKSDGTGKIHDYILEKLDEVCDWAEKYQIYLIIDNHNNHTIEADEYRYDLLQAQIEAVFSQLAPRYKDRSEYIIYELQNEPSCHSATVWYKIQEDAINLIRKYDTKHAIVVSCIRYSNIDELTKFKPYKDSNLIYSFHTYEPDVFTGQGALWRTEEIRELEGLPFPYDKTRIPELKGKAKGLEWYITNEYPKEGTVKYINQRIKKVADWAKKKNVRVMCGEWATTVYINPVDRIAYIKAGVDAFKANNIPYTCAWGVDGEQGFLKTDDPTLVFPDDIDKEILEAYGFSMPDKTIANKTNAAIKDFPQKPYIVYDGFLGKGTIWYLSDTIKSIQADKEHGICLKVSYPCEPSGVNYILPKKVTSCFNDNAKNFSINISVKFSDISQKFRIDLSDTDGGEELPPWNNTVSIKASDYKIGEWVTIEIPVSKFTETGAWSNKANKWFDAQGKFDWNRFESITFHFDDFDNKNTSDIYIDDVVIKKK